MKRTLFILLIVPTFLLGQNPIWLDDSGGVDLNKGESYVIPADEGVIMLSLGKDKISWDKLDPLPDNEFYSITPDHIAVFLNGCWFFIPPDSKLLDRLLPTASPTIPDNYDKSSILPPVWKWPDPVKEIAPDSGALYEGRLKKRVLVGYSIDRNWFKSVETGSIILETENYYRPGRALLKDVLDSLYDSGILNERDISRLGEATNVFITSYSVVPPRFLNSTEGGDFKIQLKD
jgi:hypothetical protein